MKNSLNMIVSDAIKACRVYEYVFDGEVGDVFEFPERPKSNEANITIGNLVLRLVDENVEFDCYSPKKDEFASVFNVKKDKNHSKCYKEQFFVLKNALYFYKQTY